MIENQRTIHHPPRTEPEWGDWARRVFADHAVGATGTATAATVGAVSSAPVHPGTRSQRMRRVWVHARVVAGFALLALFLYAMTPAVLRFSLPGEGIRVLLLTLATLAVLTAVGAGMFLAMHSVWLRMRSLWLRLGAVASRTQRSFDVGNLLRRFVAAMDKITSRVRTWPFLLCAPLLLVARAFHWIDAADVGWLIYTSLLLGCMIGFVDDVIVDNLRSANRFVEIRSLGVLLFLWVLESLAIGFASASS